MGKEGRSFFERLTGTVNVDEFEEEAEELNIADEEKLARQKRGGLRIEREDLEERIIENEPYEETHLGIDQEEGASEDWMEEENESVRPVRGYESGEHSMQARAIRFKELRELKHYIPGT